jgi:hypothetical protein
MSDSDINQVYLGIVGIRKLLTKSFISSESIEIGSPIQEIIDAGIVPTIIQLIEIKGIPQVQYEAIWCITNIATGTQDQVQCLVDKGVIPKLINLMQTEGDNIKELAIWALGNIAGDSKVFRDIILLCNIIIVLLDLLVKTKNKEVLRTGCWLFRNLVSGKQNIKIDKAIPVLCKLIKENEDKEILKGAFHVLMRLCSSEGNYVPIFTEQNILPRLIQLLK